MQKSTRGIGGKRVNRVNLSITNHEMRNINRLATSCNMRPTTLAEELLTLALADPTIINYLQDTYNLYDHLKIIPFTKDGRTTFEFKGGLK